MRFAFLGSLALVIVAAASSPLRAGQSAPDQPQVTFAKDVAPILQNNCQVCHRPGSMAPMSLLTYADARPWAASIRRKVAAREMPPWFIDKNGDAWTGSMFTDRVARLDIKSGRFTEYMLPRPTNIRRVYVDDSKKPGTLWIGSNHGASIVKVEPLD